MKFRMLLLGILFVLTIMQAAGQLKHYFTQNVIIYKNYYNKEVSKTLFPLNFIIPNLSYKLEIDKVGMELYFNDIIGSRYHLSNRDEVPFTPEYIKNGDLVDVNTTNIGVAVHYSIYHKPWLKINPSAGLVKNWYRSLFVERWVFTNEPFFNRNQESRLGLLLGLNINVPVWKGIYCNANSRYTVFPGARYNKQNLIIDVGIGYMYQKN